MSPTAALAATAAAKRLSVNGVQLTMPTIPAFSSSGKQVPAIAPPVRVPCPCYPAFTTVAAALLCICSTVVNALSRACRLPSLRRVADISGGPEMDQLLQDARKLIREHAPDLTVTPPSSSGSGQGTRGRSGVGHLQSPGDSSTSPSRGRRTPTSSLRNQSPPSKASRALSPADGTALVSTPAPGSASVLAAHVTTSMPASPKAVAASRVPLELLARHQLKSTSLPMAGDSSSAALSSSTAAPSTVPSSGSTPATHRSTGSGGQANASPAVRRSSLSPDMSSVLRHLTPKPPGSVMTSASKTRSIGTTLRTGASDAIIPLGRATASAVQQAQKSGQRTFDSVLASFPRSSQFAIREMILDIMELEMRRETIEERLELVRQRVRVWVCVWVWVGVCVWLVVWLGWGHRQEKCAVLLLVCAVRQS